MPGPACRAPQLHHAEEKEPKSGKVLSVPLIDQAAAALDKFSRRDYFTGDDDLMFRTPHGTYVDGGDVRQRFYSALRRAKLGHKREGPKPMVFHDLRHTFGTLGARIWPLPELKAYMGHASVQTTMIYLHHVPKASAADALSRLVSDDVAAALVPQDGARIAAAMTAATTPPTIWTSQGFWR